MSSSESEARPVAQAAHARWVLPAAWQALDLLSDLHLHAGAPGTVAALERHLAASPADAFAILGDLSEVWVGDDAADEPGFEAQLLALLARHAERKPIAFLAGNRDFMLGDHAAAQGGLMRLADPCVLDAWGTAYVLSHGDALCLDDTAYQAFRAKTRDPGWQAGWLAQPLAERRRLAAGARAESRAHQAQQMQMGLAADVDADAARALLHRQGATTLIHGHTHRPAQHELGTGMRRWVLSDWDHDAPGTPRGDVLRLTREGPARVAPSR